MCINTTLLFFLDGTIARSLEFVVLQHPILVHSSGLVEKAGMTNGEQFRTLAALPGGFNDLLMRVPETKMECANLHGRVIARRR